MTKKQRKAVDKRVERAYYATCSGIAINIMNISKVFERGRQLVASDVSDEELGAGIREFVETIREN